MNRSFLQHSRKAFTLLEFLVIVAILAVMAAIIFPIMGRSGHDSSQMICQSNLKQIFLSMAQYAQDYDNRVPLRQQGHNRTTGWATVLEPYLKSAQIFQCPTETTPGNADPASATYSDYFINSNLSSFKAGRNFSTLLTLQWTIVFGEGAPFSSSSASNGGTITSKGPIAVNGTGAGVAIAEGRWDPTSAGIRHKGRSNYCFADGHVKSYTPESITREPTSVGKPTFRWSAKNPPVSGS